MLALCHLQTVELPEFSNKDERNRYCLAALVRVKLYRTLKNPYIDFSEWWLTHCIAFPLLDTVDLFGLTLDNSLNFGKHITKISKKVGKQLDVLCRLKNILSFRTKLCLYNSFIMSHFHYCSSIWHHCLKSDSKKLDRLHEQALRYLYSDESSQTSTLSDRIAYSLVDRRIQNLLIIVSKTINNYPPENLRDLLTSKTWEGLTSCKYRNLIRLVMARTQ